MAKAEHKNLSHADETRRFELGKLELINIGGGTVGRLTLEPGWRWSKHVKSIAGTEWCEAPHFQYQVSGNVSLRLRPPVLKIGCLLSQRCSRSILVSHPSRSGKAPASPVLYRLRMQDLETLCASPSGHPGKRDTPLWHGRRPSPHSPDPDPRIHPHFLNGDPRCRCRSPARHERHMDSLWTVRFLH